MNNPGLTIEAKLDLSSLNTVFNEFADQIPYATTLAINETAKDVQKAIRGHIHDSFIVRRASFIDNSIKIKPFATKETLSATVAIDPPGGERRDVLSKFEEGGTKTSINGGNVAVPMEDVFPDDSKVIPQSKRPRNLKGAFRIISKNGKAYLFTVVGRGKARIYKLAYALESSVKIPPKLHFYDTAVATVDRMWEQRWNEAYEKAINTAFR